MQDESYREILETKPPVFDKYPFKHETLKTVEQN